MKCCAECFGDRQLRNNLIPILSDKAGVEIGRCSYCESENVSILAPTELADYFESLISTYRPHQTGKLLVQWFRDDWGIFEHPRMDEARANSLLEAILEDREIVHQPFLPYEGVDRSGEWDELRNELRYRNRFFPIMSINLEELEALFTNTDDFPLLWYRARMQSGSAAFSVDEMGAPSKGIASHGRANPAGIPYLYLGSTQVAAISEIRPHTGAIACIADYTISSDLKLVDLRKPRKMVSPFLLEAEDIQRMRSYLPLLDRLGEELTRPVLPHAAAVDYTPSQYLCEFIKKCRYDGVIYRSSVSDGINLALFDPSRAQVGGVTQYRIDRVSVDATAIVEHG